MLKVIVAGSRDFSDYRLLKRKLDELKNEIGDFEVVSGTANGADKLGERYAEETGLPCARFPADWSLGKKAGFIRNTDMGNYADILSAFWDGESSGTKNMIDIAKKKGLRVEVAIFKNALQCHSKGDRRFSALCAKVEVDGTYDTIENHYQLSKRFGFSPAPTYWKEVKGKSGLTHFIVNKKVYPKEMIGMWYKLLWVKYLDKHPELVEYASKFDEFIDIFKGKSMVCQADVIKSYVKEGRDSIIDECKPFIEAKKGDEGMTLYIAENIFEFIDKNPNADCIVIQAVNCKGVMGRGLAKAIRERYPDVYNYYQEDYKNGLLQLGYVSYIPVDNNIYIANMCTQDGYGTDKQYTSYEALRMCLEDVKIMAKTLNIHNIIIPYKICCGLGGGSWDIVYNMIGDIFTNSVAITCNVEGLKWEK